MSRSFRPNSESSSNQRPLLKDQLNLEHPLVKLSQAIEWSNFESEFGKQVSSEGGRPPLPTRLIVGLHYLKALDDESDESVVTKWVENPYWQYFCGEETFQHEFPCHPTSLLKWRQRVGVAGVEKLLGQVLRTAMSQQALKPSEIARVNVDTTVQEKAIAFPTDARLYDKARRALVRVEKQASGQTSAKLCASGQTSLVSAKSLCGCTPRQPSQAANPQASHLLGASHPRH